MRDTSLSRVYFSAIRIAAEIVERIGVKMLKSEQKEYRFTRAQLDLGENAA